MRNLTLAVSLVLVALSTPIHASNQTTGHKVLAAYYLWYGTPQVCGSWLHWNEANHDPERLDGRGYPDTGTTDHPQGLYDSGDPAIIKEHLKLAQKAGIDVLVTSWWGRGHYTDKPFASLVKESEKTPVKACVYYETVPAPPDDPQIVSKTVRDLEYILDSYGKKAGYFKHNGAPVIFIYSRALGQISYEQWAEIVRQVKAKHRVMLVADSRSDKWLDVFESLHEYNPVMQVVSKEDYRKEAKKLADACRKQRRIATVTIIPGYDDSNIGRKAPIVAQRKDGVLYREMWSAAISVKPDWIMVCSFNEWHEGSQIEPSREHGDQYINLTSKYSRFFKDASNSLFADAAVKEAFDIIVKGSTPVEASSLPDGGLRITNLDSLPGVITVKAKTGCQLVFLEEGRAGKAYRRVTASARSQDIYSFDMRPYTAYQVWTPQNLSKHVLSTYRARAGRSPSGVTVPHRLQYVTGQRASIDPALLFLADEALASISGVQSSVTLDYPAGQPDSYKICVDQLFTVTCNVRNSGKLPVKASLTSLKLPDIWTAEGTFNPKTIPAGSSASWNIAVTAPVRSLYGTGYPVSASWTVQTKEGSFRLQNSTAVQIVHPFDKQAFISGSSPTEADMLLCLKNNFPGRTMRELEVEPSLPDGWTCEPEKTKIDLVDQSELKFHLKRNEPQAKEMRVVSSVFKMGEYVSSKRCITDLFVTMGQYPRTAGLWLVDVDDGRTELANYADTVCRKAVDFTPGHPCYMYFGVSDNIPVTGNVYVAVCYFDQGNDPFELQYDSTDPAGGLEAAYKRSESVKRENTRTWRTHTFVMSDAKFGGAQNGQADFRIASITTGLNVAWVSVSKFPARISD